MIALARRNQRGVAMVTAIVLALVVSVIAAAVLSLTMRRFELSAFRTDHSVAEDTSEAGFQYAFARLDKDAAFKAAVEAKRTAMGAGAVAANNQAAEYVVSCHDKPADADTDDDQEDELVPAIHMGSLTDGKHLRVRIRFFTAADNPPIAGRPYRVRAFSYFGTGEEWR